MCYYHLHFHTNLNLVVNIFKQGTEESNYILSLELIAVKCNIILFRKQEY